MKRLFCSLAAIILCLQVTHGIFHIHEHAGAEHCHHSDCLDFSDSLDNSHTILEAEHLCSLCHSQVNLLYVEFVKEEMAQRRLVESSQPVCLYQNRASERVVRHYSLRGPPLFS